MAKFRVGGVYTHPGEKHTIEYTVIRMKDGNVWLEWTNRSGIKKIAFLSIDYESTYTEKEQPKMKFEIGKKYTAPSKVIYICLDVWEDGSVVMKWQLPNTQWIVSSFTSLSLQYVTPYVETKKAYISVWGYKHDYETAWSLSHTHKDTYDIAYKSNVHAGYKLLKDTVEIEYDGN